jgi:hypothetical protein
VTFKFLKFFSTQFGRNISNIKNDDDFDVYDQDLVMTEEERKCLHQSAVVPPIC